MMEVAIPSSRNWARPFVWTASVWWILSSGFCGFLADPGKLGLALAWSTGLILLSLFDLFTLVRIFEEVFFLIGERSSEQPGKRFFSVIRASYWGTLKIACTLLFGIGLSKGGSSAAGVYAIPTVACVTGMATLVVVPLVGGLLWHLSRPEEEEQLDT